MLRRVGLPGSVRGALFLHSMPGRYEPLEDCLTAIDRFHIQRIICVAPLEEIRDKSPEYFRAIVAGDLHCEREVFDIPDFDVPQDRQRFIELVQSVSSRLKSGEHILIHCAGGIGRTGMVAICVLLALNLDLLDACAAIGQSGSRPATQPQWELIRWIADQIRVGRVA